MMITFSLLIDFDDYNNSGTMATLFLIYNNDDHVHNRMNNYDSDAVDDDDDDDDDNEDYDENDCDDDDDDDSWFFDHDFGSEKRD